MTEVAHPGEDHRQPRFIRCCNDVFIPDRAARLDDRRRARFHGGKQAVRAILFTCSQFPGVKKVEVLVDGEKPALPEDAQSTFINDEQEVIAQYPGVVELD